MIVKAGRRSGGGRIGGGRGRTWGVELGRNTEGAVEEEEDIRGSFGAA